MFYTPQPVEKEVIVQAYTLEEAVQKVHGMLGAVTQSIKGGWEIKG